jgi:hypothetical protein
MYVAFCPPFTPVAVKVTELPIQIEVPWLDSMLTDAGTVELVTFTFTKLLMIQPLLLLVTK